MESLSVLGGIIGSDGHLSKDNSTVCVINKDLEFIDSVVIPLIQHYVGKEPKIRFINSGFGSKKYLLRVCNSKFLRSVSQVYNIPIGRKSSSIEPPRNLTNKENIDFLRGWIAGDGSVTTEKGRPKIEIWSKSKEIIYHFEKILRTEGICPYVYFEKNKKEYILRISRKEDVIKFYKTIKIPHPKKQRTLENLTSSWFSRIRTV
ncbi:MAG: LAGLIDADG family homing endonuclease [Candidatus Aenigmarchaeota archaeon]|nr:LAGLIDADG family homing endonuclease [Candidatus Aenigmarchaeota archaeon]